MRPQASRRRPVPKTIETMGRKHRPDYLLVVLCAALLAIGLVVVFAISPALSQAAKVNSGYFVGKQLIAIVLAIIAFVATAQIPLTFWRQMAKPLIIVAGLATLIALVTPVNPEYPAHRWVRFAGFSFQSVELAKFAVLIAAASFFAYRAAEGKLNDMQATFKPLLIAIGVAGVLIAGPQSLRMQSDLGSMAVLIAMVGAMCFVAGLQVRKLLMIGVALVIFVSLVILPSAYRRERISTFLNPSANCQDAGYQACQAMIAVGSGGMAGLGLGRSVQAYGYLPEAANDSIFAIYAEKFGFIGSVVLLGLLVGLFARLKLIAERAPDLFSRLVVTGVLAWLSVQAIINIGAMIGLLPLKGITLPFVSYGGTSVVFVAAAIGLVFQISKYTSFSAPLAVDNQGERNDNRRDGRRLRGAYHPDSSGRR